MTDFILQFTDEPTAQAALPQFYNSTSGWDTSITIPSIQVSNITSYSQITDPDTGQTYQVPNYQYASGSFIGISGDNTTGLTEFDQTGWTCQPVFA